MLRSITVGPSATPRRSSRWATLIVALSVAALGLGSLAPADARPEQAPHFWLTILHNNDGESRLIDAGTGLEDFGGIARFRTLVDELRADARTGPDAARLRAKRGAVLISSGDNFLAGPVFSVSLRQGPPFYDSIALDAIGYDAMTIGNHEFDFGPDVLADFIEGFGSPPPFLSANLDVSAEPRLHVLAEQGIIVASTIVKERGERIGIVGATTPLLPFISSPRDVVVDPDVVGVVQAEIDRLEAMGVEIIILSSHLQSIDEELALAEELDGVDVMIAGGGDELLANDGDLLVPGHEVADAFGPYPLMAGPDDSIPVVTTPGNYAYVGRLTVGFDRDGEVLAVDPTSGLRRVSGVAPDAVVPDPYLVEMVVEPLQAELAELAANVVATSEVALDGLRTSVRTTETNQGNLMADSMLWASELLAGGFGVPVPDVAFQNGGGIRNDSIIPAGPITELDTFAMAPFPNFVSVIPDVSRELFKETLENAVSRVEFGDGRFAQVAGFSFVYDAAAQPRLLDSAGTVIQEGQRVRDVTLDDGTPIVVGGVVQPGDPLSVATIDFLARGGDQYPFGGLPFTTLGVTYQQTLLDYLEIGLGGVITSVDYPEGGEGRITRIN
jgi:2',3'-cyclic-nucleotide 2'-phosphodiesterase (5'-nucleotidase family)